MAGSHLGSEIPRTHPRILHDPFVFRWRWPRVHRQRQWRWVWVDWSNILRSPCSGAEPFWLWPSLQPQEIRKMNKYAMPSFSCRGWLRCAVLHSCFHRSQSVYVARAARTAASHADGPLADGELCTLEPALASPTRLSVRRRYRPPVGSGARVPQPALRQCGNFFQLRCLFCIFALHYANRIVSIFSQLRPFWSSFSIFMKNLFC